MEKDKMIQEIACKIERIFIEESQKEENKMYPWQELPVFRSVCEKISSSLVSQNVRIIPEGSVVLTGRETQHYYAFKAIEPEIRGCMDRERELIKKLEQRDNEIKELNIANKNLTFQLQCHDDEVQRLMKENGKLRFERDFAQKIAQKGVAREYNKKMAQEIEYHNFENTSDYEYMNTSNNEILKEFGGVEVEE